MFESFESLPESTTTVKSGKYGPYNQTKREAQTRWVLNPGEGVQVVVDLTTTHRPESKTFSSTITWGTVETKPFHPSDGKPEGAVWSVYSWGSDHKMMHIKRDPVARYSVKALEAHHAEAMTVFEALYEQQFASVFVEAAERNGLGVSA